MVLRTAVAGAVLLFAANASAQTNNAPYVKIDGTRTANYAEALASWKNDSRFAVDYSKGFLGLEHAYARGLTGAGLVIGVNDAGVHMDHPFFASEDKFIGYVSGVNEDYGNFGQVNPRRPWESHGTHVAGTIAADFQPDMIMFGNAFNAQILSATANFAAGDFLWYADLINGQNPNTGTDNIIGMAQTGLTRIINNSWGSANSIPHNASRATILANLTTDWGSYWDPIKEHDVLVVWSAGNSSGAHAGYTTTVPMTDPTLRGNWLSVANYAASGTAHSSSSLCGQTATWCVAGPGANIISGVNDVEMAVSEVLRLFPVAQYSGIYSASTVNALNSAAQTAFINELNAYLNAQYVGGPTFDEDAWLERLAERAVGITVVYGFRYTGPDGYTGSLSSLLYNNRGLFDADFLDALYRRADERLAEVYESILIQNGPAAAAYTGTSMAAPNISGFAGLLMEYFPEYNTSLISDILVSSSLDLDIEGVDLRSGWGAPQMGTALEGPTALRDIREVNVGVGTRDIWTNPITDARDRYSAEVLQYNQNDIGGLTKVGGGELVLTNTSTYTGATSVLGGMLTVNGALTNSDISVSQVGIIGGVGSLKNLNALSGGVVAPGDSANPYGTLSVIGDATFNPGSFLWIRSDLNASQYSTLDVGGKAIVEGGNVLLKANAGNWNLRTRDMVIVTAAGGVDGTFDAASSDLAFLKPVLTYDSNTVYLTLVRNDVSIASLGATQNQSNAGEALNRMTAGNTSGNLALEDAILDGSASAVAAALPTLTGEVHASLGALATADSRFIRNAVLERGRGQADVVQPLDGRGVVAWASGTFAQGNYSASDDYAGFRTRSSGYIVGVDKALERGHVGVAFGQNNIDLSQHDLADEGEVSSRNIALYGGMNSGVWAFRLGAAWTQSDLSAKRTVSLNSFTDRLVSDYEGDGWQAYGEVSWNGAFGGSAIEPYLNYARVEFDADVAEKGGDAALGGVLSETADLLTLGMRTRTALSQQSPKITLVGNVAWTENLNEDGALFRAGFADGPAFDIRNGSISGDALQTDLSMNVEITARTAVDFGYSGSHGDYNEDRLFARVNVKF